MKKKKNKSDSYEDAWHEISGHHLLSSVARRIDIEYVTKQKYNEKLNGNSFGYLEVYGVTEAKLYINSELDLPIEDWKFIFATVCIILGLDLYKFIDQNHANDLKYDALLKENSVFLFAINYVANILGINSWPEDWADFIKIKDSLPFKNEYNIYDSLLEERELYKLANKINLNLNNNPSIYFKKLTFSFNDYKKEFSQVFAENLVLQAKKTISLKNNQNLTEEELARRNTEGYKALRWFVNHYPLLSALAAQFKIIEDAPLCQKNSIEIAAVSASEKTIFINPLANLNEQGMRFVIAHEVLHIALNHTSRRQGRDPLIWNLACDFVINHWLVTMNVGIPPENIYMDKSLAGKSADEIYLMISQDTRLRKKLGTLRKNNASNGTAKNSCDMLDEDVRYFAEFEEACKESLLRGMFLHETMGKGDLPADLIEEIKALNQPAIPWQVELANWIAERFPLDESKKTYSRPSRRQSSTPDIPRPRYIRPQEEKNTRTFGVILDTSASMDRNLLGKCLGAIASYSSAQEVKYIRLIFCDAQPYDEGFVPVELLAHKIKVKGRGGTVLQQAVNYLENKEDFPDNAPILILTDGYFENDLIVKRDHAFLVPNKAILPIVPKGKVFEFK